jgi:hypothetical protein
MLRNTLISTAALAFAGATHAGLATWTLTGTGAASGTLATLGNVNITLTMSIDSSASALQGASAIYGWNFTMSDSAGTELFRASGTPTAASPNAATYIRWTAGSTSTRRYTVVLGGTTSSSWTAAGSLPAINLLELGYVANRTAGVYGNFGDSLVGSAGGNGGFLMAAATGGGSFGAVSVTNFVIVPTPGAAALAIVAGIASFRRRRA